ncbi:MAG: hypothetical protein ACYC7L_16810 [Nitrospirota bacterium]
MDRIIGWILSFSLIAILCIMSINRASVYSDEMALWGDTVLKSPFKARPHHKIGLALIKSGNVQSAIPHFEMAIAIDPYYVHALTNLAVIYRTTGRSIMAYELTNRALKSQPDLLVARSNLALWYYDDGFMEAAIRESNLIIQKAPMSNEAAYARELLRLIKKDSKQLH